MIFEYAYIASLGEAHPDNAHVNVEYLFWASIFVIILHRIVSGYAIWRLTHKWSDVLLQIVDLLMVKCIYLNYKLDIDEPSNCQRYLQVLEATFESSPQLLIAMGYLAKIGISDASPIVLVSTLTSLISLTSRIASDDKAMFIAKMKDIEFNWKALRTFDFSIACNFWYILRVFL